MLRIGLPVVAVDIKGGCKFTFLTSIGDHDKIQFCVEVHGRYKRSEADITVHYLSFT
jgi:hypothetical protein